MRRWLDRFWWVWGPTFAAYVVIAVCSLALSSCREEEDAPDDLCPKIIQKKIQIDD